MVAIFGSAAYFYTKNKEKVTPPPVVEDVKVEETVKAADQVATDEGKVVSDQKESATQSGVLEYTSKYFETKNGFNALGVSWQESSAAATDISFYLRAKKSGVETQWFKADKVLESSKSGVSSYAAETPILVEGDQYQYRVTFKKKTNKISNVEINIINTDGATETNFFQKLSRILGVGQSVAAPSILSRSAWGAGAPNNTKAELQSYINRNGLNYDADKLYWPAAHAAKSTKFIVHHTAGQNNPTNPAAAVRAIWVYHTFSRGWGDIGYNYLVDQNGKIYEGRYGGDHVVAGHAAPYNYDEKNDAASIGISVLGDFSTYAPNSNIQSGLARIIGYKSYMFGINPTGKSQFDDKYTYNIAAHRDYTSTACPGAALYAKLATIRTKSASEKSNYGPVVSGFSISDTTPLVGESITGSFTIKNTTSTTIVLERLKIEGKKTDGSLDSFGGFSNVALQPAGVSGDSYSFRQTKEAPTAGKYNYYILYKKDGLWTKPVVGGGVGSISLQSYGTPYNVRMTSSLALPEFPVATTPTTGAFTLENTGDQPVKYDRIKIVVRQSNGDFGTSGWAYSDVTIAGKSKYNFNLGVTLPADTYALEVEYYKDGTWSNFAKLSGVSDSLTRRVFATPASLSLGSGITLSKTKALVGESVGAKFTIENKGDQPLRLSSLAALATASSGSKYLYPDKKNIVLCRAGLVASYCSYSGPVSYDQVRSFSSASSYKISVQALAGGRAQAVVVPAAVAVVNPAIVTVQAVNYNNVILKSFATNDSTPAVGQPLKATYRIYNNNSYPMTFRRIKVDVYLSNGKRADFAGLSGVTIPAKSYIDRVERRVVDTTATHTLRVAYQYGSTWRRPVLGSGVPSTLSATPHYPVIKVVSSLNITPAAAIAGSTFTATFKLKNYEKATVYIGSLKTGHTLNNRTSYFPGVNIGLSPGETITYSQSKIIREGVNHTAHVTYKRYNGSWTRPSGATSSIKASDTFKVYIEVSVLGGQTLPASSGRIAREQHLDLVADETASQHYSRSGVPTNPTWLRNGMAGGYGSFGGYGYPPVADERYYITMRWNYVDWYSGTLGDPDQMYCGSGYEYYSVNYYNSYKYNGQYCVPRTYSRNADLVLKLWHWKKRVVVTNPANGKKVVVSIVESGPAIWTGRKAGLSPEAMLALGISASTNGNNPLGFAWAADQATPLGPVN